MPMPSSKWMFWTGPVYLFFALATHQIHTAMNTPPTISGA